MYFQVENKTSLFTANNGGNLSKVPHIHTHIEIVLLRQGLTAAAADSKESIVENGDLFIAMPNQVHYYIDLEPVRHQILIVRPDICSDLIRICKSRIPESPVLKGAADNNTIVNTFDNIIRLQSSGDELEKVQAKGYITVLLSEIFKNMNMVEKKSYDFDIVKSIISYCYENYTGDISLQSISDSLHISKFYISHLFSRRMHIGFIKYINSLRINKACELLTQDKLSVTEIAYAVGYNSIRTFDRCFIKEHGMTPKEYRSRAFSNQ